ncbi:MAG: hypothetical protein E6Q58_02945 [Niabella sp.]|nr:MAG: hypothetical protein E6Q58_02945 [Niabella sp.]
MQKLSDDIIVILGASIFLLVITLFIVFLLMAYKRRDMKHLKEKKHLEEDFNSQLLHSKMEVQEQTFQQIGKELHDNVGQLLSTSRMLIGLAERSLATPPDTLMTANATLGKAISELRSLSKSLDKEWLAQFNLFENLKAEVSRINSTKEIEAFLYIDFYPEISSGKQIILFRILQEAIQNKQKNSKGNKIIIKINKKEDNILIEIIDNGRGYSPEGISKGMGLDNMIYRTKLLGGTIRFISSESGTTIRIQLPQKYVSNEN